MFGYYRKRNENVQRKKMPNNRDGVLMEKC